MFFFLLPILLVIATLILVFLWASRSRQQKSPTDSLKIAELEETARRHATHCPQIRQALDASDFEYLTSTGGAKLAQRVRYERREVLKAYLVALRSDFDQLLKIARAVAVLSPEVVAVHEFERLWLTVEFNWRYRLTYLRLLLGATTLPQISDLSDFVGRLAVRLDAAMKELGERAALAADLASSLDRRNLNTV